MNNQYFLLNKNAWLCLLLFPILALFASCQSAPAELLEPVALPVEVEAQMGNEPSSLGKPHLVMFWSAY
ncbi:MAG: hypothetical protein AB8G95_19295 [Anaerolineae bacterium]